MRKPYGKALHAAWGMKGCAGTSGVSHAAWVQAALAVNGQVAGLLGSQELQRRFVTFAALQQGSTRFNKVQQGSTRFNKATVHSAPLRSSMPATVLPFSRGW
jgi:hypothetical protein